MENMDDPMPRNFTSNYMVLALVFSLVPIYTAVVNLKRLFALKKRDIERARNVPPEVLPLYLTKIAGEERKKACEKLEHWYLAQLIFHGATTFAITYIISNYYAWHHWFFLVYHFSLFCIQSFQMFFWPRKDGRPWYRTFMPSDMTTTRYDTYVRAYIAFLFCYSLCVIGSSYIYLNEIRILNLYAQIDKDFEEQRALERVNNPNWWYHILPLEPEDYEGL